MDPVTLVVTALMAGASAGLKDTASEAIKDAYGKLKSLVSQRLRSGHPDASAASAAQSVEHDTPGQSADLSAALTQVGAADDAAVLRAASALLEHVSTAAQETVTITGGQGVVGINKGAVSMTFGNASAAK